MILADQFNQDHLTIQANAIETDPQCSQYQGMIQLELKQNDQTIQLIVDPEDLANVALNAISASNVTFGTNPKLSNTKTERLIEQLEVIAGELRGKLDERIEGENNDNASR